MKFRHTSILVILIAIALIGIVAVNTRQVSAPRDCAGCIPFKKLTHEFEKNVIEAATVGDPNIIPSLLEQYSTDVRALDLTSRR